MPELVVVKMLVVVDSIEVCMGDVVFTVIKLVVVMFECEPVVKVVLKVVVGEMKADVITISGVVIEIMLALVSSTVV